MVILTDQFLEGCAGTALCLANQIGIVHAAQRLANHLLPSSGLGKILLACAPREHSICSQRKRSNRCYGWHLASPYYQGRVFGYWSVVEGPCLQSDRRKPHRKVSKYYRRSGCAPRTRQTPGRATAGLPEIGIYTAAFRTSFLLITCAANRSISSSCGLNWRSS